MISCAIPTKMLLGERHITPVNYKSIMVQVIVWCRQAIHHNLSRCWPTSMSSYDVARLQCFVLYVVLFEHGDPIWKQTLHCILYIHAKSIPLGLGYLTTYHSIPRILLPLCQIFCFLHVATLFTDFAYRWGVTWPDVFRYCKSSWNNVLGLVQFGLEL